MGTLTVESDRVTVRKHVRVGELPLPAVVIAVTNDNEDPVAVRVVDQVPDEVDAADVATSDRADGPSWQWTADGAMVFTGVLAPGGAYSTGYVVQGDRSTVPSLSGEPAIAAVVPLDDAFGTDNQEAVFSPDSRGQAADTDLAAWEDVVDDAERVQRHFEAVLDAAAGGEGARTGSEPSPRDDSAGSTDGSDRAAGTAGAAAVGERTDGGFADRNLDAPRDDDAARSLTDPDDDSERSVPEGSIAEALLAELEADAVSREVATQLGRELRVDRSRVRDIRLQQLSRDVDELRAYTNALEAFIDEEGSAEEVLGAVREEARELTGAVEALETELEQVSRRVEARGDRLERVVHLVEELGEDVEAVAGRTDDLAGDVDDVADRTAELPELREQVATLEGALAAETEARRALEDDVADVQSTLEGYRGGDTEERIEALESTVETVTSEVASLSAETDAIHAEVEELAGWVGRVRSIFAHLTEDLADSSADESDDGDGSTAGEGPSTDRGEAVEMDAEDAGATGMVDENGDGGSDEVAGADGPSRGGDADETADHDDDAPVFTIDLDLAPDDGGDGPDRDREGSPSGAPAAPSDETDGPDEERGPPDSVEAFRVDLPPEGGPTADSQEDDTEADGGDTVDTDESTGADDEPTPDDDAPTGADDEVTDAVDTEDGDEEDDGFEWNL